MHSSQARVAARGFRPPMVGNPARAAPRIPGSRREPTMQRRLLVLLASVAVLCVAPGVASGAGVAYPDADWSEAWIPSSDGVTLHADVLRPKGATDADKTPVVLSIGPYFNHSG